MLCSNKNEPIWLMIDPIEDKLRISTIAIFGKYAMLPSSIKANRQFAKYFRIVR